MSYIDPYTTSKYIAYRKGDRVKAVENCLCGQFVAGDTGTVDKDSVSRGDTIWVLWDGNTDPVVTLLSEIEHLHLNNTSCEHKWVDVGFGVVEKFVCKYCDIDKPANNDKT